MNTKQPGKAPIPPSLVANGRKRDTFAITIGIRRVLASEPSKREQKRLRSVLQAPPSPRDRMAGNLPSANVVNGWIPILALV